MTGLSSEGFASCRSDTLVLTPGQFSQGGHSYEVAPVGDVYSTEPSWAYGPPKRRFPLTLRKSFVGAGILSIMPFRQSRVTLLGPTKGIDLAYASAAHNRWLPDRGSGS